MCRYGMKRNTESPAEEKASEQLSTRRAEEKAGLWETLDMQTVRFGENIEQGLKQCTANAESVMADSDPSIMMSLQMQHIRCLLWWMRSSRFPDGGSLVIHLQEQRPRIGTIYRQRIISAMRKKEIKSSQNSPK